jgi:hypothetical protein
MSLTLMFLEAISLCIVWDSVFLIPAAERAMSRLVLVAVAGMVLSGWFNNEPCQWQPHRRAAGMAQVVCADPKNRSSRVIAVQYLA